MKRFVPIFALILLAASAARAAMPEVLPYGVNELNVPKGTRENGNNPRVVDLLGAQYVGNPDAMQRARIIAEIGSCELPNGVPHVRKAMDDAHPLVRAQAARAVAQLGDKSLLEYLRKLATDADARVRVAAVQGAGVLGGDRVIAAALQDADGVVVAAAVGSALPANVDAVAAGTSKWPADTQLLAIRTLGRLAAEKHAGVIAPYLDGPSVAHRAAAAAAGGQMKATSLAASIDKLLADKHPTVRREALGAMANLLPAPEFHKRAIAALTDADLSVREQAANLLAKSPTPDAVEALAANLPSESSRLHLASRSALVAIGQPAVPRAEQLLADPSPRRREDGSFILGRLKSDAGIERHVALLADKDWGVVRQAAQSLGLIGRTEAVVELARIANLAGNPITDLSQGEVGSYIGAIEQAIVSCTLFNEKSIIPVCRKVLPDKRNMSSSIRAAAAYALGRMDDPKGPVPARFGTILGDQEDASDVKIECLKGLGHMKAPAARRWAGTSRKDAEAMGDTYTDWLAYWVRWRLTGKEEPYVPLTEPWAAPVSIYVIP